MGSALDFHSLDPTALAWRLDNFDLMHLRQRFAHEGDHGDMTRLSDVDVRRLAMHQVEMGRWKLERQPSGELRVLRHGESSQAPFRATGRARVALEEAVEEAVGAVRRPVVEEKRYPFVLVIAYKHPTAEKKKPATPRFKLENILTGPETRRSGELKPSDPLYIDLRRREMRPGDYRLEFLNHARQARPLEPKK